MVKMSELEAGAKRGEGPTKEWDLLWMMAAVDGDGLTAEKEEEEEDEGMVRLVRCLEAMRKRL